MNTWPNREGLRRPLRGGCERESLNPRAVRPRRPDSSQQASSKPGAVHCVPCARDVADQGKQTKANDSGGCLGHKDCMRWALKQFREALDDLLAIDLVAEMWKQAGNGSGIFKRCSADNLAHGRV